MNVHEARRQAEQIFHRPQANSANTLTDYEARSRDVRQKIEYLRARWLAAQARPQSLSVGREAD
jgi:hypothetical protein